MQKFHSRTPQGSVLGLQWLTSFVNDLDKGINDMLIKLADDKAERAS